MDEIRVLQQPLELATLDACVAATEVGGRALFVGAVRDQNQGRSVRRIDYEAFVPMAEKVMVEIAGEARSRFAVERIGVHHRIGSLAVGDIAVLVAVGARHRAAAFDACRYIIDELKQRAPIWKKESYEDGNAWVSPTP